MTTTRLTRRTLLRRAPAWAGVAMVTGCATRPIAGLQEGARGVSPFTLGVASGDPVSDGMVLWTRLAPQPLTGGGMPADPVVVEWQVATDEAMRSVVQRGSAIATPELAHSVHVEVQGLQPGRWYWYRFAAGGFESPIGRTRTAPAPGAPVDGLRFALASCQHYGNGYCSAYRHMARDELDLVLFVGDYIYEFEAPTGVRRHDQPEPVDLAGYRNRYAIYKSDPELQAVHARCPWITTWDDHEVSNDYADDLSQNRDPRDWFMARRAAAYQAYYEHMPLRRTALPNGIALQLHRRLRFGDLVEISVLDNRQFRSHHPCTPPGGKSGGMQIDDCAERRDAQRSMLGGEQERWLFDGLARSSARWNVIAQQQLMAQIKQKRDGKTVYWNEAWDGYPASRARLLRVLADRQPANAVVLGGDIHSYWVTDLKENFDDPRAPAVATEFVGTSITSNAVPDAVMRAFLPDNPHVKFYEGRKRGYARCEVSPKAWLTDFVAVDHVRTADAPASVLASFAVEPGRAGAIPIAPRSV
ncbi:MAG: alkaline phosphatase D family protein [Alphaproteobacteria bacterium]|nr:alkaline phosphatase D family protein [Alphaproteobacteria bacterium]